MDLIKQYIAQSITIAANNLRLNNQQIEIVALLKESITKSDNLSDDLINMKKITELSMLAIRLNDIYNFLSYNPIDLLKLSDQFKEHSRYLIKDLRHLLDVSTPTSFKSSIEKLKDGFNVTKEEIRVDLSKRISDKDPFDKQKPEEISNKITIEVEHDPIDDDVIQKFESSIINPIKPLDNILKKISTEGINHDELIKFANIMKSNALLSKQIGFEILTNMHYIVSDALILINDKNLIPGKEVIDDIRACFIVIVAVVKGKKVDISSYLNRAEEFGLKVIAIKNEVSK